MVREFSFGGFQTERVQNSIVEWIAHHIEVSTVNYEGFVSKVLGESSRQIRAGVISVRENQKARFIGKEGMHWNANWSAEDILASCNLDAVGAEL